MKRKRKKSRAYQALFHADRRVVDRLFDEMYQEMQRGQVPLKDLFAQHTFARLP